MSAGYLRELTLYSFLPPHTLKKTRRVVHCSAKPPREADASEQFLPRECVFFPHSRFLLLWAVLSLCALLYQTLTIPVFLMFQPEESDVTQGVDVACCCAFLGDALVALCTSFYRNGELVYARREIFGRYVRTWMVVDLLSAPPYHWLLDEITEEDESAQNVSRFLRCLRLLRVLKLPQTLFTIRSHLPTDRLSSSFSTGLLVLAVVHIAHWVACGFYFMSSWGPAHESWLFKHTFLGASVLDAYVASLDWTLSTLTTTGFGNIAPCSIPEKLYGIVIMLMSVGAFSYFIGRISANVLEADSDEAKHQRTRLEIARYLKAKAVPKGTLNRALRHMEYGWVSKGESLRLDPLLLQHFSEPLRNEISEHMYGKVLATVPMFTTFEASVIRRIARSVEEEVYAPDDLVISERESSTEVYFLEKGTVDVFHQQTEHTFAILKAGQHFGEFAFFTGCARTASVRCIEFCDLLKVPRSALLDVLPLSPSSIYAYRMIQSHFESSSYSALGVSCFICGEASHIAKNCSSSKIRVNRDGFRNRWLRKRTTTMFLDTEAEETNTSFKRRKRKVRQALRYTLRNVKASGSWDNLKGAGFGLIRHIDRRSHSEQSRAVKIAGQEKDSSILYQSGAYQSEEGEESVSNKSEEISSEEETPTLCRSGPLIHLKPRPSDNPIIRERASRAWTDK